MIGFPGTIGGMLYMNASAHNQEISTNFVEAEVYDRAINKVINLDKN